VERLCSQALDALLTYLRLSPVEVDRKAAKAAEMISTGATPAGSGAAEIGRLMFERDNPLGC
jgi:hypothetical protein